MDSGTEITSNLLQAMTHSGAYLSGAFISDRCVGAAFAFPATNESLHLHSHMTAVLDLYRDQGVGYALKIDQWRWAKEHSFSEITWTFDPLVSRNARFNLMKLGVDVKDYLPNFYGEMADALNAGDESDRLLVSWKTSTQNVKPRNLSEVRSEFCRFIAIPEDIVEIRSKDQKESMKWRLRVRDELMNFLNQGGKIVGFSDKNEYVLQI
jgi:predicted GNAT superfamily acetyltransferase